MTNVNKNTTILKDDRALLMRAVELAGYGIRNGGGPFGAVIARNGAVLSEAWNKVVLNTDPTAHAEILAIRQAASEVGSHNLGDCTLYTSCEPCPMCLGAIYWAGIKKVVYECDRTDAGAVGFSDKLIYDEIRLDPADRKIAFVRLSEAGGAEVLREWEKMENKIPY
jgi:tRNA(Arg) A34 adenosine deaminase TadA